MTRARREQAPSDAEWKVLNALWRKHPASARDLLHELRGETGWAYTTLKTVLGRMHEKGLVSAEMRGNTAWYEPVLEQQRARKAALKNMIERVFEGAAGSLLAHLVDHESLDANERKQLTAWIADAEKREGRRARR